jgi:hypothetical protein
MAVDFFGPDRVLFGTARDAEETATLDRDADAVWVVTARGGLRVETHNALRPIASEVLTAQSWSQRVALCVPEEACAMTKRSVLVVVCELVRQLNTLR